MRPTCKKCGENKTGSHNTYCRSCYNLYKRQFYQKNRLQEIERSKIWNKKNARRVADNMQNCRIKRPDFYKNYTKKYRKDHPEKTKIWDAKKRAERRYSIKKTDNPLTESQWQKIKKAADYKCHYCKKKKKLTIDHVIPLSRGGTHDSSNIVPACFSCNSRKQAKILTLL